jgi:DNA-binding FadR family transcriptional regulator
MLEPIKTEKLYKIIIRRISDLIEEQKLEPGDRLPSERELAAALSVSRASVRQAIAVLSSQGILVMRQGDGTFVADPEKDEHSLEILGKYLAGSQIDPDDILEVRLIVECEAAKLCAIRARKDQIIKIQEIFNKKNTVKDGKENTDLNQDLHFAIVEGAQNKALSRIIETIWKLMSSNMWPLVKQESVVRHNEIDQHQRHHEQIVNAIVEHDSDGAYKAMYNHLMSIKEGVDDIINSY